MKEVIIEASNALGIPAIDAIKVDHFDIESEINLHRIVLLYREDRPSIENNFEDGYYGLRLVIKRGDRIANGVAKLKVRKDSSEYIQRTISTWLKEAGVEVISPISIDKETEQ